MSYSFSVKAQTADDAMEKVREEMDKLVETQPVHSADRQQALNAAVSFLSILRSPKPTEDVYASVSGSVWSGDAGELNSASVNISVGFTQKA